MLDFLLPFADAGFTVVLAVFAINLLATVYRQFKDITQFIEEVRELIDSGKKKASTII